MKQTESVEARVEKLAAFLDEASRSDAPDFSSWLSGNEDEGDILRCLVQAVDQWETTPEEKRWWVGKILTALRSDGVSDHPWTAAYLSDLQKSAALRPPTPYIDPCVKRADAVSESGPSRLNRYSPLSSPPSPSQCDPRLTALVLMRDPGRHTLVLLGDPGSGKTSALQAYLQELACAAIVDESAPIPLLIDLTEKNVPVSSLKPESLDLPLDEVLNSLQKRHRRAVLLFDGLDRASARYSAALRAQIVNLAHHVAVESLVLTCQLAMWPGSGDVGSDTQVYTLLPFRPGADGEVDRYLRQRFGERAEVAKRMIEDDPRLREMLSSPLLLGLIADLLAPEVRRPRTDGTRSSILASWVEHQVDTLTPDDGWYRDGRRTIEELAHFMTVNDRLATTWDDLAASGLTDDHRMQDLLDRAAQARILAGTGRHGRHPFIRFVHQTFQEYYASGWLLRHLGRASEREVKELVSDTRWDEPFLLAFEREKRPAVITTIVSHLLGSDPSLLVQALRRKPLEREVRASCARLVEPVLHDEGRWVLAFHGACALNDETLLPELIRLAETHSRNEPSVWDAIQTLAPKSREKVLRRLAASSDTSIRKCAELTLMLGSPAAHADVILRYAASDATEDTNAALPALAVWGTSEALDTLVCMARRAVGTAPLSRHPVAALARVGSDEAWRRLASLLADASLTIAIRDSCIAAVASMDDGICLEIGLCRARQRANEKGWPLDTDDEEMRAVVDAFSTKWPAHSRTPPHLRRLVLARMLETDEWVRHPTIPDPTRSDYSPPPRCDLWYRVQRSRLLSEDVRNRDANFLATEFLRDETPPDLFYDVLRALAAIDPSRAVSTIQSYLSRHEKMPVAVAALGPYVSELPESWTRLVMETYRQCDELWTSGLARCVSLLPRMDRLVVELVSILDSGPEAKVLELMTKGVFWPDDKLINGLRRWVDKTAEADKRIAGVGALAMMADADALAELVNHLPEPFKKVSVSAIAAHAAEPFFPEWAATLAGCSPAAADWQVLTTVVAGLLACLPEDERSLAASSWRAVIPPQHRWVVFLILQDLTDRRTYELT